MAEPYEVSYADTSISASAFTGTTAKAQKRQPRRLSKPRTNSSSTGARPRLSLGSLDALTKSAANSVADLLSPGAEKRSPQPPSSDQVPNDGADVVREEEDLRTGSHDGTAEPSSKAGRLQRTGTRIAKHLSAAARPGFNKSASTLALNQIAEHNEDYEWLKEKAQRDRQAMHDRGQASEDVADAAPMPYRRKSMLTPGLATRGGDVLRKPVDANVQARYYNPHLSPVSPLARIASLDSPARIGSSLHSTRAVTPSERDYGLIGGALRIANGRAYSPSLSHVAKRDSYLLRHRDPTWRASLATEFPLAEANRAAAAAAAAAADGDGDGDGDGTDADSVSLVDPTAFDPYAEDVGNPWSDKTGLAEDITAAFAHASQPTETMVAGLADSPSIDAPAPSEEGVIAASRDDDYFGQPSEDAYEHIEEQRDSQLPSKLAKEQMQSGGRRSVLMATSRVNAEDAMLFEDEPPIIQPPRLGPPTPLHRPSTGEAGLRDSRLEMARILDHMMAASRYTPVQRTSNEEDWPSSAASDMPSPAWSGSGSSSHSSLASAGKIISPAASAPQQHANPLRDSRASSGKSPVDVIAEDARQLEPSNFPQLASATDKQLPELPTSASDTAALQSVAAELSADTDMRRQDSSPLPPSPMNAATSAKQARPAAKKLQKRPPRPRSMPPVPVDRIVVSGHRDTHKASPIPEVPEEMRMRVAERWVSKPLEDREPTVPKIEYEDAPSDYFAGQASSHTRNNSAPQLSPGAPPIPEKSSARRLINAQPGWQQSSSAVSRSDEDKLYMKVPHVPSPGASSSVYSQSQYQSQYASRPQTAASRPPTSDAYATTDDDAPIDWSQARRVWAARRQDARQSLQRQIERAREQIEANGSLFDNYALPANLPSQSASLGRLQSIAMPDKGASGKLSAVDKRSSLHFHLPLNRGQYPTSPLSQPSAAPSPLKPDTIASSPSANSWVSSGRHRRNVRSEYHGSYFPTSESVASGGTGFEGDVDTDHEHERLKGSVVGTKSALSAGRYEGGLQFGYEKGKGVGGSAGTRGVADQKASRKKGTGNLAQGFGVDLSDVPVFVTRSNVV